MTTQRRFAARHAAVVALSVVIAALLYWVSSEYRSEGILGALQDSSQFVFVVPYIVGAVLGSNVHNPNAIVFFIALVVEVYAAIMLTLLVVRVARRNCRRA
jgi:hypothetical protein